MYSLFNSKKFKFLLWITFILYFLVLLYVLLLKFGFALDIKRMCGSKTLTEKISCMQLIPGKTIMEYFINEDNLSLSIIMENILGNIIAFSPLGFLLPLLCKQFKKFKNIFIISFLVTLSIELIQGFSGLGSFDIDDLILNVLGSILGFVFYKLLSKIVKFIKKDI